ncbi:MAG: TIGR04255 family protein [Nannocystaceae bacterium]
MASEHQRRCGESAQLLRYPTAPVTAPPTIAAFHAPPVSEVVLGVQFEPITALRAPLIAGWSELRAKFPVWEEKAALRLVQEWFGVRAPSPDLFDVRLGNEPPPVRAWLVTKDESELLQIQEGALFRNWRRRGEAVYPRYSHLRGEFQADCRKLFALVDAAGLGLPAVTQCEVTYVNTIPLDGVAVEEVIQAWRGGASDNFLPEHDATQIAMHYTIPGGKGPTGRLHVVAVIQREKKELTLTLTARGAPEGTTLDDALDWLDVGRRWVVSGFCSVTTEFAKVKLWRRSV